MDSPKLKDSLPWHEAKESSKSLQMRGWSCRMAHLCPSFKIKNSHIISYQDLIVHDLKMQTYVFLVVNFITHLVEYFYSNAIDPTTGRAAKLPKQL